MKVLQINAVYNIGSTGRNVSETHLLMLKNGIESYVAYSKTNKPDDKNLYHIGSALDVKLHGLFSRISGKQAYFSHIATANLIKYMEKIKPDVVHLHNLHGNYINLPMLMKYLADKKISVVITFHDFWFITGKCMHFISSDCSKWQERCGNCPNLQDGNRTWFFDKTEELLKDKIQMFSKIDKLALIGVSKWTTSQIEKSPIARYADIVKLIYNWIDTEKFRPKDVDDLKKKLQLNNKKVIVGVADRWSEKKGLSKFIELANKLGKNYVVLLVGRMKNDQKFPPNIISVGLTNSIDELVDYYNLADFFVTMSLEETFGKVSAEALSCGTPVICFNSTANPELVCENCGAVVPTNDVGAMINEIHKLENKDMSAISKNCRAFAKKNFEKEKNIKQYIKLYKMICGEN